MVNENRDRSMPTFLALQARPLKKIRAHKSLKPKLEF